MILRITLSFKLITLISLQKHTMSLLLNLILMIRKSYDMDLRGSELNYSQCIANIHYVY